MALTIDSPLPPAREIPSTFLTSARTWWTLGEQSSAIAEERLFRRLPSFRSESDTTLSHDGPAISTTSRVALNRSNHFLNTLSIIATHHAPDAPPPAVLFPGYGGGIGVFLKNLPALAEWAGRRGSRVYAVGMDRSARIPFIIKSSRSNIPGRIRAKAEAFFIDSLEDWRLKMQLEQMTLIGHSLGAYFSASRAHLEPEQHFDVLSFPQDEPEPIRLKRITASPPESHALLLWYLWEWSWTPFHIARCTLFWGPLLVGRMRLCRLLLILYTHSNDMITAQYALTHFSGLTDEEKRDKHDYILNIILAKGSGEYCIAHLIPLSSYARIMPLVDRITALTIPITIVYGDRDWMDTKGGAQCIENLRKEGNIEARSVIVVNAGHQVYFDDPTAVNELLVLGFCSNPYLDLLLITSLPF
ncbi:alpha beta-hydrolase [Mycena crocata]|nr:alpha beta-hydrolase [Mycena crocata]